MQRSTTSLIMFKAHLSYEVQVIILVFISTPKNEKEVYLRDSMTKYVLQIIQLKHCMEVVTFNFVSFEGSFTWSVRSIDTSKSSKHSLQQWALFVECQDPFLLHCLYYTLKTAIRYNKTFSWWTRGIVRFPKNELVTHLMPSTEFFTSYWRSWPTAPKHLSSLSSEKYTNLEDTQGSYPFPVQKRNKPLLIFYLFIFLK